ncbi:MAG: FAD-binding oxidoreductase [Rubrivivax sp.]
MRTSTSPERAAHAARCKRAAAALRALPAQLPIRLAKASSNLFRDRVADRRDRLDLGEFTHVIEVDPAAGWVDVEGGCSYEDLVAATLPRGVMPAVVPQLKTITAGGAAAGVGIEATSFRHGLVHHTMQQLDVLLPDGRIAACTPHNEHAALFHAFPNSYGTLGYALRLRLATLPVKPCVQVRHRVCGSAEAAFEALAAACEDTTADFVDGVVFARDRIVVSSARFVEAGAPVSDYSFERIYYRSLLKKPEDTLSAAGYLWRWDTDWFWCSKNFGLQHPLLRRLAGRARLNSRTYTRWMRWNARWGLTQRWSRLAGLHRETVIQDVDIPLAQAAAFLDFLLSEIGILPVWICPLRAPADGFTLYPLAPGRLYVNFGFWDVVRTREAHEPGHFNRRVEEAVLRLGGIKSLYSDSFFSRETFDATYGGAAYAALKARLDPQHRLPGLYEKCVGRA